MIFVILTISVLLLAFANGTNDNFKGVATLYGSGTLGFGRALGWATATTFAGSLCAVMLAAHLLKAFSGKGLVSETLAGSSDYAAAVGLGAATTVLLATRIGMPISTTHSLFGALIGAGIASGSLVNLHQLGMAFVLPLLVSPLLAMTISAVIYPMLRAIRVRLGVTTETCICMGSEIVEIVPASQSVLAMQRVADLGFIWGNSATCRNRYQGRVLGIDAATTLDWLHIGSAGIVSFARGLNDTPKIAALLLITPFISDSLTVAVTGLFIAAGGIV
ncbi:MAG: inorganic phosphate transporter, partial [Planctomycetota bacterium]|nr:inorganic phosphate transporter [Planctomycetota bacterium]